MTQTRRICTFTLEPYVFGFDVAFVQEVLVDQEITAVPLAPRSVRGVMNLRGQIVTSIDLRTRLELPARPADTSPASLVIRTEDDELVSFLVDRAGDVIEVDEERFEAPPDTLAGAARELIRGAYKLPSHLLLLLDAERAARPPADERARVAAPESGAQRPAREPGS